MIEPSSLSYTSENLLSVLGSMLVNELRFRTAAFLNSDGLIKGLDKIDVNLLLQLKSTSLSLSCQST